MNNWPTSQAIHRLIQAFEPGSNGYIGHEFCPLNTTDFNEKNISYDILGPATGLTPLHEIDTDPRRFTDVVLKTKLMETAHWTEKSVIGHSEMIYSREPGKMDENSTPELVAARRARKANARLDARTEWLIWQMFGTGALSVSENGLSLSVDYEVPGGNKLTVGNGVTTAWADAANADVHGDLLRALDLFDATAVDNVSMILNSKTAALIAANEAIRADVRGNPLIARANRANAADLLAELVGDIDSVRVYNKGYLSDANVFTKYVPDNKVILIGRGAADQGPLAEFASTPHAYNGGGKGKFGFMVDERASANPRMEVVAGIHGLPVLYHPDWIVTLTVA